MTAVAAAPVPYAPPAQRARHYPQLDGVRCVAVLMVVASHTIRGPFEALGLYGVWLFFVLSAYLITGILLRSRGRPIGGALRTFYLRRALRIFPAYYVVLLVIAVANVPGMRSAWPWHVAYLSNWYVALTGHWPPGTMHLWTLSVEEQFYLTWPLVVFLVPVRRLDMLCVAMVALAVASRGTLATMTTGWARIGTPTMASLDALGIGALLAWFQYSRPDVRPRLSAWLVLGIALLAHAAMLRATSRGYVLLLATESLGVALVSVWCIARATEGRLGAAFEWSPVRYIGQISYGVYLWHIPVAWAIGKAWKGAPVYPDGSLAFFLLTASLTVAVASASWYWIEAPVNRMKSRFPYS